jgi:glycosyltransferase involved in cell wall biosynthesis
VSLSAAIIVRDEAEHLDACLASLRDLADQIVVVDTGSSDASVDVARGHGAVVDHVPWQDDFAAPRNRGLDLATGDWVLQIDPDERVVGDPAQVRAALDDATSVAYRVRFVPRPGWTPRRELRLWRHRDDIRFEGRVHETVVPALRAVARSEGLRIAPLDVVTVRRVAHPSTRTGRRARLEPLLRAELDRDPDQPSLTDLLAQLYEAAGDGERAVATWKRGITQSRAREHSLPDDRLLYIDLVHHFLMRGVVDEELEALVDEARDQFGRAPTLELAAARLAFATGRPRNALEPLEWLLSLDDADIVESGASYDERVFGEWAWGLLGLTHFSLGDDAEAADAFRRAEELAPDDPSYRARRRLAEARAASPAG